MKNVFKKSFSICLISIFMFSQAVMAKTCPCPPPGYDQQATEAPAQPCCKQKPACPVCEEDCACDCTDSNAPAPKIEHLCAGKNSPVDLVKICGCQAIVEQHSVFEAVFGQRVFSKKLCPGDSITFILPKGLWTREGRQILPCNTQIVAKVECIVKPKALNKNAKVGLKFKCVLLPDGRSYPIQARIFNAEGMLKETKLMAAGKVALWTIGLFGVGAGLGAAIGSGAGHAGQACLTIGMPVGFGVGLLTGLISPGLHYRAKCGEKILIQLTDNLQVATK